MAWHLTAVLSFGSPPPSYPHLDGQGLAPEAVAGLIARGDSVHLPTRSEALSVLRAVGLSDEQIERRMQVAAGGAS